jgi:hypothetical protein
MEKYINRENSLGGVEMGVFSLGRAGKGRNM